MLLKIEPIAKPRMVRGDRWKKRPCVERYWEFKDDLNLIYRDAIPQPCKLIFTLSMPRSWSKKKKAQHLGKPHCQKPDLDNLCKAFFDCLLEDDGHIYEVHMTKLWGNSGSIEILTLD